MIYSSARITILNMFRTVLLIITLIGIINAQDVTSVSTTTTTTTPSPTAKASRLPINSHASHRTVIDPHGFEMIVAPSQLHHDFMVRSGFGLPAYNNPSDLFNQRINSPADYSTNGAGFLLSDLQQDNTNRFYDMSLASSENPTRKTIADRGRSDFQAMESQTNPETDLSYMKNTNSPNDFTSKQRKPIYQERVVEEHLFDPSVTKHLLKQRENDYASNGLMDSHLHELGSSDSELAQLAAISELNSQHGQSTSDYIPMSGSSFGISPISSYSDYTSGSSSSSPIRTYSGLGSLSSFSGASMSTAASSLPPIITPYMSNLNGMSNMAGLNGISPMSSMTGLSSMSSISPPRSSIPAGAIVGAPGSSPPPGMKLAGYVTMTNPSSPSISQISQPMLNPANLMANNPQAQAMAQVLAQSMAQGMKFNYPGMNPALMGVGGNNLQTTTATSANVASPTASGSSPPRTRFLSRLNPLNLFRRFRNRNQSNVPKTETEAEKRSANLDKSYGYYDIHPNKYFHIRHVRDVSTLNNDTEAAENGYFPFSEHFGRGLRFENRIRFPRRRGPRRHGGSTFFAPETRSTDLMGSGNFEVIRGGILPATSSGISATSGTKDSEISKSDEGYDDEEKSFPLDDFFAAGSPGILGFQGFNHFSASSIYNTLSASNRKSDVLDDKQLVLTKDSAESDLQAVS